MRVSGDMLTLAREHRAMSQEELAKQVGISQPQVAKIEAGVRPDLDDLTGQRLAAALRFPVAFFEQDEVLLGFGSSAYFYRKKATIPAGDRKKIHSTVNLLRMAVKRILPHVEVQPKRALPQWSVEDYGFSASNAARALRAHWHLPDGPVKNLTALVESSGVIVISCDFGMKTVDATSLRLADMPPIIFMNECVPGDRWRFTLAHELAHLVLHREPHDEMEQEADAFAGEFLVPHEELRGQLTRFPRLQVRDLITLKRFWRVSMQALIMRAFEADAINESQKRGLFVRMSQLNMRQVEPEPVDREVVSNFPRMMSTLTSTLNFSDQEMANMLCWDENDVRTLLPIESRSPIRHLRVV